jgi:hypothetical protein
MGQLVGDSNDAAVAAIHVGPGPRKKDTVSHGYQSLPE